MKNINYKTILIFITFTLILLLSGCKNGTENNENPYAPLEKKFDKKIGDFYCQPLLDNGVLYVITKDNKAHAINPENGKTIWTTEVNGYPSVTSQIISEGDYLYYPVVWGAAACLNKKTGQVVWQIDHFPNSNYSSIELDNDRLYIAGFGDVGLVAINKNDGAILWECTPIGIIHTTPIVINDLLYVATDDAQIGTVNQPIGRLYCYNKYTGEEIYNIKYGILGQGGAASDVVVKDSLIFLPSGQKVFAINLFTKEVEWEVEIPDDPVMGGNATTAVMILDGNYIYSATVWGGAYCIDISSKSLLWHSHPEKSRANSIHPLLTESKIYWSYAGGEIACLDRQTGEHYWTGLSDLCEPLITLGYVYGFYGGIGLRAYTF